MLWCYYYAFFFMALLSQEIYQSFDISDLLNLLTCLFETDKKGKKVTRKGKSCRVLLQWTFPQTHEGHDLTILMLLGNRAKNTTVFQGNGELCPGDICHWDEKGAEQRGHGGKTA